MCPWRKISTLLMRGLDNAQINWRTLWYFFQGPKIWSARNTLNILRRSFVVTLRASYYHPGTRTACPKTSRNSGRRRKPTLGCWIQQCFGHWGTKNSTAAATSKVKILTLPGWFGLKIYFKYRSCCFGSHLKNGLTDNITNTTKYHFS